MNITGGKFNGRKILAPDERITRPTLSKVRMSVFNTLFSLLGTFENKTFLDMFGGSGIMGIEAISRGFKEVVVFEKNPAVSKIIDENYKSLGLISNLKIGDACKLFKSTKQVFDVIYIDPPYNSGLYEKIFLMIMQNVNADSIIIAEHTGSLVIKDFSLIKIKKFGDKTVSFFKLNHQ